MRLKFKIKPECVHNRQYEVVFAGKWPARILLKKFSDTGASGAITCDGKILVDNWRQGIRLRFRVAIEHPRVLIEEEQLLDAELTHSIPAFPDN